MKQTAEQLFALTLDECAESIGAVGNKLTVLVQGHMGTGKSSLLKILASKYPKHIPCYFDCTTKDLGDLMLPKILSDDSTDEFVRFVPNEEMGMHHAKPIILMVDEFGKDRIIDTPISEAGFAGLGVGAAMARKPRTSATMNQRRFQTSAKSRLSRNSR